jgi:hypothetical protein
MLRYRLRGHTMLNIKEIYSSFRETASEISKSTAVARAALAAFSKTEVVAFAVGAGLGVAVSIFEKLTPEASATLVAEVALLATALCVPFAFIVARKAEAPTQERKGYTP